MKFVSDINDEIYGTIQLWEMEDSDEGGNINNGEEE